MTDLKPCPFCAGEAGLENTGFDEWSVVCGDCKAIGEPDADKEYAGGRWNNRAEPKATKIDRLTVFIEELRDYKPEIHSGRMSDPQDDVPDVIEADVFLTFQEDAITALGEQS